MKWDVGSTVTFAHALTCCKEVLGTWVTLFPFANLSLPSLSNIFQLTEFDDTHVYEGKHYEYRICAVNAAGQGKPSDVSDIYEARLMRGEFLTRI